MVIKFAIKVVQIIKKAITVDVNVIFTIVCAVALIFKLVALSINRVR